MSQPDNKALRRPRTPEGNYQHVLRMPEIEEVLTVEYDAAKLAFDQATESRSTPDQVQAACVRYVLAIQRLRKFLVAGEVPPELAKNENHA